jgi:hypothetical protein
VAGFINETHHRTVQGVELRHVAKARVSSRSRSAADGRAG